MITNLTNRSTKAMRQIRPFATFVNVAVISFLSYKVFDWAGFSPLQSITITLFLVLLSISINYVVIGLNLKFKPYRVHLALKWDVLLTDYKLIESMEDRQRIKEYFGKLPKTEYTLLRDHIKFTILQFKDIDHKLVYRTTIPEHGSFVNNVCFLADINPLKVELNKDDIVEAVFSNPIPRFFIDEGLEGYNLGIIVPKNWWDRNKRFCPKCLMEGNPGNDISLTLAIIPYSEFAVHSPHDNILLSFKRDFTRQRERFGWTEVESQFREPFEIAIEHKYFFVEHHEI
jgi:hypothetical protein